MHGGGWQGGAAVSAQQGSPRPSPQAISPTLHMPAGDFHQLPPVVRPTDVRPAQEAAGVALLRALRTSPDGKLTPEDIRQGSSGGAALLPADRAALGGSMHVDRGVGRPGQRPRLISPSQAGPIASAWAPCRRRAPFLNRGLAFQSSLWQVGVRRPAACWPACWPAC